jgi:esterase/lipase superfamily enzyme
MSFSGYAQIRTEILNPSREANKSNALFFTNRPLVVDKDSSITFKNHSTKQTDTLYFCAYNFDYDSIELNYKAVNLSDKYPSGEINHNIVYDIYEYHRLERGIKNFYIIVGGYGKSFKKQVHSYMKRLKSHYGDTLFNKAVIVTFAWGTENDAYQYYNAVRKSKKGAADFAIFQHMMDEFISDSVYFQTHPNDLTIDILFSSMGNDLFKEYLETRKTQKIPLVKVYNRIIFIGSVAPRNSFKKGKAFYNLDQMTDSVDVYVNLKDVPLALSSLLEFGGRMGNRGPKNEEELPDYINVIHVGNILTSDDLSGLGHDYLLTNPVLQEEILTDINENIEGKKKSRKQRKND